MALHITIDGLPDNIGNLSICLLLGKYSLKVVVRPIQITRVIFFSLQISLSGTNHYFC